MDKLAALVLLAIVPIGSAFAAPNLDAWQPYVSEASSRFGLPEKWLRSVIAIESNSDPKALSPKGAMGLMQLMPDTWNDMRSLFTLGSDPFDPRANILAGTAYLRAMYDRFGYPDLFAAYNVGETRYEDHRRTGKALPEETVAYVASIGQRLGFDPKNSMNAASRDSLFFRLSTVEIADLKPGNPIPANGLFVRISTEKRTKN